MKQEAEFPEPNNPNFSSRVYDSFSQQHLMKTLSATLSAVRPGEVEIELPFRKELTQQHGFLHAAAITAIVDSACGYAALTLLEPEREVLTVEFKVNFISPAAGHKFIAVGRVLRSGKTLTTCVGEVFALQGEKKKLIAAMQATMIGLAAQADAQ